MHDQVLVRTNATVDRNVAALVEALSAFPDVVTYESCEGSNHRQAYVCFTMPSLRYPYRTDWRTLGIFLDWLHSQLLQRRAGHGYDLRIEWVSGDDTPRGRLTVEHGRIPALAGAIEDIMLTSLRTTLPNHSN